MKHLSLTLCRSLGISLLSCAAALFACGGSEDPLGEGSQPISGGDGDGEESSNAACQQGTPQAEGGADCQAVAKGLCFSTAAAACACAGCDESSCALAESFPVQAFCQSNDDEPGSTDPDQPVSDGDGHDDDGDAVPGCSGDGDTGGGSDPVEPGGDACSSGAPRASADAPCDFVVGELCFDSAEAACGCAGCASECLVLESYPAQIRCP